MKTFETEFPSFDENKAMGFSGETIKGIKWRTEMDIMKFCLDKAKVREAIEKIISDKDLVTLELKYRIKELLKELGL